MVVSGDRIQIDLCVMRLSQASSSYVTECAKWGAVADDQLMKEPKNVCDLARLVTLEGHDARVFNMKNKSEERKEAIAKYALRYAIVPPRGCAPNFESGGRQVTGEGPRQSTAVKLLCRPAGPPLLRERGRGILLPRRSNAREGGCCRS